MTPHDPHPAPPQPAALDAWPTVEELAARWTAIRARVDAAAIAAGRDPQQIRLLPVSKTYPLEVIARAAAAGMTQFGENRPQELALKAQAAGEMQVEFVQIGQLQSNKAKLIAAHAAEFQALDSLSVAAALERRLAAAERELPVLVQVNTSDEPQKAGLRPADVEAFVDALSEFPHLRPRGLMTVALHSPDRAAVAACFTRLADVRDGLRGRVPEEWLQELSMGMSGDFELAIAHGSTCVRVGQAIFGPRG
ncbi:YggS family pyridoxal phosphate-dependent enzyme [Corynebacterium sp. 13CS0277]|uniref:YggS family pyridoxal phosphate-dependent enzyme n=1 Tax=Corynebacterium sp. 13CS0277 TaxID=2071994 RepID=UPI000D043E07|nr:YggS family pyridoxal phosphate-dependent enzyme [Corynebacterium sp. 13CS0277]PRQ12034.1 YggS family pyridoxal phosphate-dependent enzyme [Corynebacterium sp. 13CS0277]